MSNVKYEDLHGSLTKAREQLWERDPDHKLLGLLIMGGDGRITCTPEFDTLYTGQTYDGLTQYVTDVFDAVKD